MPFFAIPDYQLRIKRTWLVSPDQPFSSCRSLSVSPRRLPVPWVHPSGAATDTYAGRFRKLHSSVAGDHLDIPSFVLYGEGVHGVNVATWTAIKRKEKVQGILLASPGWRSEEPSVQQSLKDVESAMFVNKNGNGDGSGSLPEEAAEDILCYCVGGAQRMAGTRKEMAKYFQSRYGTGKPDFEMRFLFTFVWDRKPIPDEQLASLTCPILMLRGGDDGIVCPERAVEEWQAAFLNAKGGAEIHVISGAPAVMSLSDGNVVSRLMGQFFSKCTGAS